MKITKFLIFFIIILSNISISTAQQLQFSPQPIFCTPFTIIDVLRGQPIPSGLLGRCLLDFAKRILIIVYTVSLLISVGFIIYSGALFATKPNDENAKKYLIWAVIGVIITISAFSLVKAIEYSLTR